ncbi:hypothetical protein KXJ74_00400 [Acinetobacter johnsonii]|nr:hypothetical protein KXJ74_00400 [Acinetobacter johnsonii]
MIVNLNIVSKNLLFILVILYIAQGSIYSSGSMIGKLSLFVILGISVIYFIKCLKFKHDNPIFFYGWTTLFFLNMIGFFVGGIYDGTYYSQIRNISTAMLPFYPFYYFSKKNSLKPRDLLIFFYILIPISIMDYYSSLSTLLSDYDEEKIVNNSAYLFVALIPFIFLIAKRKILAMLTLLTLLFFIVESSKRGH